MKIYFALLSTLFAGCNAFTGFKVSPMGVRQRSASTIMNASVDDLKAAEGMIDKILDEKNCGPVFVRLAWHDSGTFDKDVSGEWPAAGGAIGSIRFEPEILHGANAGLAGAVKILEPVKEALPR